MRTDQALEALHEAYNYGDFDVLTKKAIYNKRRNILNKQQLGFSEVIFCDEIFNVNDVVYTRIKKYK
jgi:hypothetical protein